MAKPRRASKLDHDVDTCGSSGVLSVVKLHPLDFNMVENLGLSELRHQLCGSCDTYS